MGTTNYSGDLERILTPNADQGAGGSDSLAALAGERVSSANEQLTRQMGELSRIAQQQIETTRANTQALEAAGKSSGSTASSDTAKGVGGFLLKGLTLAPLIGGLAKLFGGGEPKALPPLERFNLPEPIRAEAALSADGRMYSIDRGMGDQIRVEQRANREVALARPSNSGGGEGGMVQNITVQISAMDSRSFLDRSDDIARAVREAMLHSHSINDVVNDL